MLYSGIIIDMKNILITGGTGFFANAFTKHLLNNNLSERICIYSRDEHKQALMRQKFNDDKRLRFFIGDVRDQERLTRAMHGVDTVIHTAALKRIEACYYNPDECVKTNVHGAMSVINSSMDAGVNKVIALSTDKAFNPVSVYGYSKAMAEALFIAANNISGSFGPRFSACRYGNIWNSTGSIVPKWKALIEQGSNKVPVTDPECTRFFMTIEEAVDLVLNTLETMQGGEIAIPDLPAYRVGDLVEAMGVTADVIGLPKLEKLHESMRDGESSNSARRMSIDELKEALRATL